MVEKIQKLAKSLLDAKICQLSILELCCEKGLFTEEEYLNKKAAITSEGDQILTKVIYEIATRKNIDPEELTDFINKIESKK